eukprot:Awhi_evm1s8084
MNFQFMLLMFLSIMVASMFNFGDARLHLSNPREEETVNNDLLQGKMVYWKLIRGITGRNFIACGHVTQHRFASENLQQKWGYKDIGKWINMSGKPEINAYNCYKSGKKEYTCNFKSCDYKKIWLENSVGDGYFALEAASVKWRMDFFNVVREPPAHEFSLQCTGSGSAA